MDGSRGMGRKVGPRCYQTQKYAIFLQNISRRVESSPQQKGGEAGDDWGKMWEGFHRRKRTDRHSSILIKLFYGFNRSKIGAL